MACENSGSSTNYNIYLNGALVGSGTSLGNIQAVNSIQISSSFDGYNFYGQIGNVQLYNTSLSTPQVDSLYAEGITGAPVEGANVIGWWLLNGNGNLNGANVIDYALTQNYGTPTAVNYVTTYNAFTYNEVVYASNGVLMADSLTFSTNGLSGTSATSNVFTFSTTRWPAGTYTANIIVSDRATTYNTVTNSITFTLNSMPTISITPSTGSIYSGQSITFVNTTLGGTEPYTFNYIINNTSGVTVNKNIITFADVGTYNVIESVTDNAAITSNSPVSTIKVTTQPPHKQLLQG